jgi:hypothetical protein
MFKTFKELYNLKPNGWYYATVGCFIVAMVVDVNTLRRLRKLDREVWTLADHSTVGPVHDDGGQRIGDVPPISPVAGTEVAEPVLADEDLTTPENELHADSGD